MSYFILHNKTLRQILLLAFIFTSGIANAKDFSETSYLVAGVGSHNIDNPEFWSYLSSNNNAGITIDLTANADGINITGTTIQAEQFLVKLHQLLAADSSKIIPVFINIEGRISLLDSVINESSIAPHLFYLPRGEAWPSVDYLIQSQRRVIMFISDNIATQNRMFHRTSDYAVSVRATGSILQHLLPSQELLVVRDFEKLPISRPSGSNIRNLVPDYINFLLEIWTRYGKRPNFIFVDDEIRNFDFIISQLNSFTWFTGTVKDSGKPIDRIYWKNPEVSVTGGHFSFPYRGGEELTLTPFVPGYQLTPAQIIVTGEMEVPESYNIMATPLDIYEGLTASFRFDESILNLLNPDVKYTGENYSFTQDIERGTVLRLPENSSIDLKSPEHYGLRNSSFSVSCFVKFSEILEFGDNAILGNYESEYRRGLHLILRSGHPYFGLWANDYVSDEKLEPNTWYHIVWRYTIETGEQAIFLNGKNIGSSEGHPPFMGTGSIYLGSALSQGANLRGYIDDLHIWKRPLGIEEITRLSLNEQVRPQEPVHAATALVSFRWEALVIVAFILLITAAGIYFRRKKKPSATRDAHQVPLLKSDNQILLFGGFRATDREGNDITGMFTPKIKELLLFTLMATLKNSSGASIADVDEHLWPDMPGRKVSNNRAVSLNKLRKVLQHIDGLEIVTLNGSLVVKYNNPFYCDFVEAYHLCNIPGGMDKAQLERFYELVNKGVLLKGISWQWADDMRGYTGNQVIDNLLKLADIYRKEKRFTEIELIARIILEYDDLNEEATWLIIWYLRQKNNGHQARFYFDAFCERYQVAMGENFPMDYGQFKKRYAGLIAGTFTVETPGI